MNNINLDKKQAQIFRKLVKIDLRAQKQIRELWLENQLDCIDYDDYYGSFIERQVRVQAKKLTPIQLTNYMIEYYDAPFEIFSKKAFKTLTAKEREIVMLHRAFFK